jgi:hypothetical protein
MASLDDFLAMVRGRLPGCPDFILKDAVRDAAIEFCKRTQLLTETVPIYVTAGSDLCELTPLEGQHWEVLRVLRDTSPLTPMSRHEVVVQGFDQQTGSPAYYYLESDPHYGLALRLAPTPDAAETLTALVTVRPTDDATDVDCMLWSDYREPIAAGARAWVRRNHGDWVNPELEAEDRAIFERAIHNQNIRRARGGTDTALRVRAYPF